jgi:hypothetical protein
MSVLSWLKERMKPKESKPETWANLGFEPCSRTKHGQNSVT